MAKRKALRAGEPSKFEKDSLFALAKDLQTRRLPLERITVSDDMVTGLRAVISKSGQIALSASYHFGDERPFLKLGELSAPPKDPAYISIDDARELTKTIKSLADKGIDPQEGLHKRLIRELKEQGTRWRPK